MNIASQHIAHDPVFEVRAALVANENLQAAPMTVQESLAHALVISDAVGIAKDRLGRLRQR